MYPIKSDSDSRTTTPANEEALSRALAVRRIFKGEIVVPFRRSFSALILALAAVLAAAQPDQAAAEDSGAIPLRAANGCIVGYRFEPGPIVNGNHRQPTPHEFEARMRVLREFEQTGAFRCAGTPVGDKAI